MADSTMKAINILDYGAKADGSLNTAAIQRAVDACPPGGKVLVPEGCFVTGALFLKGQMTLELAEGAVLLGSSRTEDFPVLDIQYEGRRQPCYASLINICPPENVGLKAGAVSGRVLSGAAGEALTGRGSCAGSGAGRLCDITICGSGTLHGNGAVLGPAEMEENLGRRGRTIYAECVDGFTVTGVTIREAPAWCFHLFNCRDIVIRGISLYNKYTEDGREIGIPNNDGIDPECCRNVVIEDCFIESEDDNVAIKSGRNEAGRAFGVPSENIRISGCRFSHGFGVVCGSEMSGGVRNVLVENCSFTDSFSVGSLKNQRGRGAAIENVRYENCTHVNRDESFKDCKWYRGAINIDQFYGIDDEDVDFVTRQEVTEATPAIRNITFRNVSVDTVGGSAIYICGLPEMHVQNIVLDHVKAAGRGGLIAHNVDGLVIRELELCVKHPGE